MPHAILSEQPLRVRSFTDLRRFAAERNAGRPPAVAAADDAFHAHRRQCFEVDRTQVGAIDLPAGQGRMQRMAADEFIVVCNGALSLRDATGTTELHQGASIVLPRGSHFSWLAEQPTTLISMRHASDSDAATRIVPIDTAAPLQPSGTPRAELLIGPTPSCRNHTDFQSADGRFICGTWDSTPYRRRAMLYPHSELMVLLEGAVTLEDETGARHTFERDDIFVVEHGAQCSWDSAVHVKKVYAITRSE